MFRIASFMASALLAAPALAQDEPSSEATIAPPSALDVTVEIDFLSDYRFRGVSRSDEDPAAQAAVTLSHDSGVYAGARATTLKGVDSFRLRDLGDVEVDLYAGWRTPLGGGFDLDAGLTYYVFAGGGGATDHAETYASLSYLIGPAQLMAGARYAPSQRAIGGEDMFYLFGQVDVTIPSRPWSFTAQAGRQDSGAFGSYWTWSLGAQYQVQLEGIPDTEIGVRYIDSDLPSAPGRDAGLVGSIAFRF